MSCAVKKMLESLSRIKNKYSAIAEKNKTRIQMMRERMSTPS
jgi:hypothetical protein